MSKLFVPIILGASRPSRQSEKVAQFVLEVAQSIPELETQLVDVKDFAIPFDEDTSFPPFHAIVEKADAFFLVFPEYNHSYPGKLKTLLDTEFDEYKHKPVAMASVSSGAWGGVRAIDSITPVLVTMGMIVTGLNVNFPLIEAETPESLTADQKKVGKVKDTWEKLLYLTQVIKKGKEAVGAATI